VLSCDSGGDGTETPVTWDDLIADWWASSLCITYTNSCEEENTCIDEYENFFIRINYGEWLDCHQGENPECESDGETLNLNGNSLTLCDYEECSTGTVILGGDVLQVIFTQSADGCTATATYTLIKKNADSGSDDGSSEGIEENCSDIANGSEWNAVILDINVLDDMAGCSYEDSTSDASNMNWAFQSGVVEQNDSNSGAWTIEKYYECTTDDALKICLDQEMTNDCIIYSVEVSNNSLSLIRMIVEGNECDREETLNFIPEDDSTGSHGAPQVPDKWGSGCTDSSACNFNPWAINDDGTCEYENCP